MGGRWWSERGVACRHFEAGSVEKQGGGCARLRRRGGGSQEAHLENGGKKKAATTTAGADHPSMAVAAARYKNNGERATTTGKKATRKASNDWLKLTARGAASCVHVARVCGSVRVPVRCFPVPCIWPLRTQRADLRKRAGGLRKAPRTRTCLIRIATHGPHTEGQVT